MDPVILFWFRRPRPAKREPMVFVVRMQVTFSSRQKAGGDSDARKTVERVTT